MVNGLNSLLFSTLVEGTYFSQSVSILIKHFYKHSKRACNSGAVCPKLWQVARKCDKCCVGYAHLGNIEVMVDLLLLATTVCHKILQSRKITTTSVRVVKLRANHRHGLLQRLQDPPKWDTRKSLPGVSLKQQPCIRNTGFNRRIRNFFQSASFVINNKYIKTYSSRSILKTFESIELFYGYINLKTLFRKRKN